MALIAPTQTVKIAGEHHDLVFDFEAIFRLEKATGASALSAFMDNSFLALTWLVPALAALLKMNPPAVMIMLKKSTASERAAINQALASGISGFYAPDEPEEDGEKKDAAAE